MTQAMLLMLPSALALVAPITSPVTKTPMRAEKSRALPWLERPAGLDSLQDADYAVSLTAGDFGFDPLGWAEVGWGLNEGESQEERDDRLYAYRDAEVKHGRLAMLAAIGWPVSELYDGRLSERLGLPTELVNVDAADVGMAPSLLNGGLGQVTIVFWLSIVIAGGYIEGMAVTRLKESARVGSFRAPGDLGFDPLGLYPKDEDEIDFKETSKVFDLAKNLEAARSGEVVDEVPLDAQSSLEKRPLSAVDKARRDMIEQELTHGRTAMLAIVGFVVQEFVTKVPVVEETPQFFIPNDNEVQAEIELEEISRVSFSVLADVFKGLFGVKDAGAAENIFLHRDVQSEMYLGQLAGEVVSDLVKSAAAGVGIH